MSLAERNQVNRNLGASIFVLNGPTRITGQLLIFMSILSFMGDIEACESERQFATKNSKQLFTPNAWLNLKIVLRQGHLMLLESQSKNKSVGK